MFGSGNPEAAQCRVPCVSRKSRLEVRTPFLPTHVLEGLTELGAVFPTEPGQTLTSDLLSKGSVAH